MAPAGVSIFATMRPVTPGTATSPLSGHCLSCSNSLGLVMGTIASAASIIAARSIFSIKSQSRRPVPRSLIVCPRGSGPPGPDTDTMPSLGFHPCPTPQAAAYAAWAWASESLTTSNACWGEETGMNPARLVLPRSSFSAAVANTGPSPDGSSTIDLCSSRVNSSASAGARSGLRACDRTTQPAIARQLRARVRAGGQIEPLAGIALEAGEIALHAPRHAATRRPRSATASPFPGPRARRRWDWHRDESPSPWPPLSRPRRLLCAVRVGRGLLVFGRVVCPQGGEDDAEDGQNHRQRGGH